MNYRCYGMVFVAMLLTACKMGAPPEAAAPQVQSRSANSLPADIAKTSRRAPVTEAATSADGIESRLSKDMAYADLRDAALGTGWKPVVDLQCKENVIGGNHAELCSARPDRSYCRICDDVPELSSCSGDGYCGMTFSKNGQTFGITTYGMIEDWNVRGDQSRLNVLGWQISK